MNDFKPGVTRIAIAGIAIVAGFSFCLMVMGLMTALLVVFK